MLVAVLSSFVAIDFLYGSDDIRIQHQSRITVPAIQGPIKPIIGACIDFCGSAQFATNTEIGLAINKLGELIHLTVHVGGPQEPHSPTKE